MKPVDKQSNTPAYLQIYLDVRKTIASGALAYGAKLPSKRSMAEETGTSVITIEHAYDLLIEEGYVEAKTRSGYYVTYDFDAADVPLERVAPPPPHRKAIADFPFSVYATCARKVIADYGERLLVKSPNNGCPELRAAIADYLMRAKGINVQPSQIVVGAGAEYLYGLCVQLLGRDKTYAIEMPSYQTIYRVYRANGVRIERLKMGRDGIMSAELNRATATVLHVTPFSSYPTGITATAAKRAEYIAYAEQHSGYVIEDDFNSEFCLSTKPHDALFAQDAHGRVIYINTFSKSLAPSLRIGYMILPTELLARYRETIGFYSCTASTFDQYVLAEFIAAGHFERYLRRVRRKLRKQQRSSLAESF